MSSAKRQKSEMASYEAPARNPMLRNLIIMSAAVVLLAALTVLTLWLTNILNPAPPENSLLLTDIAEDKIQSIVCGNAGEDPVELIPGEEGWALRGVADERISKAQIEHTVTTAGRFSAFERLADQVAEGELSQYGLEDGQADYVKVITKDGGEVTLKFGAMAPDKGLRYMQKQGDRALYTTNVTQVMTLLRDVVGYYAIPALYVDTHYITHATLEYRNMERIVIEARAAKDNPTHLENWFLTEPYQHLMSLSTVVPFFEACMNVVPMAVVAADVTDWAEYGLDDPTYTFDFTDATENSAGNTAKLSVSELGPEDAEGYYYCRVNDGDLVCLVLSAIADRVVSDPLMLTSSFISLVNIEALDALELSGAINANFTCAREEVTDLYGNTTTVNTFTLDGANVPESPMKDFYQTLIGTQSAGKLSTQLETEAILTVNFILSDKNQAPIGLRFLPYEADKIAVTDLEGNARFYIRPEDLQAIQTAFETMKAEM